MNSSWPTKKLGEICTKMKAGGTPNTSEEKYWNGYIAFALIEDLVNSRQFLTKTNAFITKEGLKNSNSWLVPENSIVLSLYATVGKPVINKIPVAITQNMVGIIPNNQVISTEFLFYVLEKCRSNLWRYIDISVHKHITVSEARNIPIILPPLPEQQKIVYVLDTIQEAIGVQEKIIEKTKELKRAMMNLLFHYGTAILKVKEFASLRVGELTSEEFEKLTGQKLKKTEIGEIPESWEVVKLGEVTLIDRGLSWKRGDESKSGVLVVSIPNILDGAIDFTKSEIYLSIPIEEDKKLKKGDILFVGSSGSPENLGRSAMILKEPTIPTSFASFLLRIRPTCQISTNYLNLLLISSYINFKKCSRRAADGKYNLQPIELKLEKIPLPSLDEQREIADILQTIDQKIEIEEKKKALYEELFKAMLDKLMTGEIRVNNIDFEQ